MSPTYLFGVALVSVTVSGAAQPRDVEVATTVAFTEGPTVYEDGTVYFTDIANNRIMTLSPDGELSTFRRPSNRANGLIFDSEWRLIACEGGDGTNPPRVTRTDLDTGELEVIADSYEGKPLNQPNDVTIDGRGRIYFTDRPTLEPDDPGVHGVYRVDLDGSIERILTEPDIERPNGIVVAPDDRTLYLIETHSGEGGARMIRAYDLSESGTVSNMRVFHDFYPGRSGDGMTIDSEGNLYVAAGLHRLRGTSETLDTKCGIHVFSPDGELKELIPDPRGHHHQRGVRGAGFEDVVRHRRKGALPDSNRRHRHETIELDAIERTGRSNRAWRF